ncbi:MAG: hypothetical protein ABI706_12480 [Ilumatobacteraceae bacterium]
MDLDIEALPALTDELSAVRSNRASVVAMNAPRADAVVTSSTSPPARMGTGELRDRLRSVAEDVDLLWYEAIDREDSALVTRSVQASHAVHRALIALEDNAPAIG